MTVEAGNRRPLALSVLAALLGESAEAEFLRQAIRPPTLLRSVEDRFRVMGAIRESAPDLVVFAAQDRDRLPTAPLIEQCSREHPDAWIVVVCLAPPPRGGMLLAAARAGARILVAPTSVEFESLLARAGQSSAAAIAVDCESLSVVQPPSLRRLLCAAAMTVAEDGRVSTFARHLGVSTRTLSRHTRSCSVASPRAVLSAVRLLRVCALMEHSRRDIGSAARATGFLGSHAVLTAMRRYLNFRSTDLLSVAVPRYRDALHHIVGALGGHLAMSNQPRS